MAAAQLVSADSHVNEPGDLWGERIEKAFRGRAPRVVDNLPDRHTGSYLVAEGIPHSISRRAGGPGRSARSWWHFSSNPPPKPPGRATGTPRLDSSTWPAPAS